MNARRPEGRPAAGSVRLKNIWEIEPSCPAVARRAPEAGSTHSSDSLVKYLNSSLYNPEK